MSIAGRLFAEGTPFTTNSPVAQPTRSSKVPPFFLNPLSHLWLDAMFLAAAVALCAFAVPSVAQSLPGDPVEGLRQTLKVVGASRPEREQSLKAAVEQVRNVNDICRALVLKEWRDDDLDEGIAAIDRSYRGILGNRFEAAARERLHGGDAVSQRRTLDLLAANDEMLRDALIKTGLGRRLGPDLVKIIDSGPLEVRPTAAAAVAQMDVDSDVAVPAFSKLLDSKDMPLRVAGASGLATFMRASSLQSRTRSPRAAYRNDPVRAAHAIVSAAGRWLNDPEPAIRRLCMEAVEQAAGVLCRRVLEPAAPLVEPEPNGGTARLEKERAELLPLILALKDQALGLIGGLSDSDPQVRLSARRALENMAIARYELARREPPTPALPHTGGGSDDAFARTAGGGTDAAPNVRSAASDPLLDALGAPMATLATGAYHPDVHVRLAVIDILESLGPAAAPAARALVRALTDPDRFVRWAAARTVGKIAPAEAELVVPGLARLLGDPDLDVRLAAAAALERYGPAATTAIPALIGAVKAQDAEFRLSAIRALRSIGLEARPAIPALNAAASDPDPRVRQLAVELLGKLQ
jgi:HEAT repeat protein